MSWRHEQRPSPHHDGRLSSGAKPVWRRSSSATATAAASIPMQRSGLRPRLCGRLTGLGSVTIGVLKGTPSLEEALETADTSGASDNSPLARYSWPRATSPDASFRTASSEATIGTPIRTLPPLGLEPGMPALVLADALEAAAKRRLRTRPLATHRRRPRLEVRACIRQRNPQSRGAGCGSRTFRQRRDCFPRRGALRRGSADRDHDTHCRRRLLFR